MFATAAGAMEMAPQTVEKTVFGDDDGATRGRGGR
jgi:hypothetical protein